MDRITLFSLIYGEIAHKIKNGEDPFKSLETIVLGLEKDDEGKSSTLIIDKEKRIFRLTVEEIAKQDVELWCDK